MLDDLLGTDDTVHHEPDVNDDDEEYHASDDLHVEHTEMDLGLEKWAPGPWSYADVELLRELHDQDLTWKQIADYFLGRSAGSVASCYQRRLTWNGESKLRLWSASDLSLLGKLHDAGLMWSEIVKKFPGRSIKAVETAHARHFDKKELMPLEMIRTHRVDVSASQSCTRAGVSKAVGGDGTSGEPRRTTRTKDAAVPLHVSRNAVSRSYQGQARGGKVDDLSNKTAGSRYVLILRRNGPDGGRPRKRVTYGRPDRDIYQSTVFTKTEVDLVRRLILRGENIAAIGARFPGRHVSRSIRTMQGHMWAHGEVSFLTTAYSQVSVLLHLCSRTAGLTVEAEERARSRYKNSYCADWSCEGG